MKKTKTYITRLLSIALVMTILLSSSTSVYAASGANKNPSKTINGFFSSVKQYRPNEMKKYVDDNAHYTFLSGTGTSGKEMQKLVQRIHSETGFNWTIKKIYTKGTTGYATVRIQYYDAYGHLFNGFIQVLEWALDNPYDALKLNSDQSVSKAIDYAYANFCDTYYEDNDYNLEVITVKIPLKKIKGKWYIDKISKHLNYSMDCRISKAARDMKW